MCERSLFSQNSVFKKYNRNATTSAYICGTRRALEPRSSFSTSHLIENQALKAISFPESPEGFLQHSFQKMVLYYSTAEDSTAGYEAYRAFMQRLYSASEAVHSLYPATLKSAMHLHSSSTKATV